MAIPAATGDDGGEAQVAAEPDQRRDEGQRVGGDVGDERAPGDGIGAQAAVLVDGLPVGLQQVVPHEM